MGQILVQENTYGGEYLPEYFQEKMNGMFQSFEFICAYIEDLLFILKGYLE